MTPPLAPALSASAAAPGGTAPARADPTPPAPPASPAHPSPPGPAAQLAPALVHVAAAADGTQRVTVRLDPAELGTLHVRIERPHEGPVQVTVEAARPETLQLLRQDQPALHRALDQAGLPAEGRVVVLQQASSEGASPQGVSSETGGASSGGQGSGRGGQDWDRSGSGADGAPQDQARRRDAWLRAGIDITA